VAEKNAFRCVRGRATTDVARKWAPVAVAAAAVVASRAVVGGGRDSSSYPIEDSLFREGLGVDGGGRGSGGSQWRRHRYHGSRPRRNGKGGERRRRRRWRLCVRQLFADFKLPRQRRPRRLKSHAAAEVLNLRHLRPSGFFRPHSSDSRHLFRLLPLLMPPPPPEPLPGDRKDP
jgi:hypothetical protein